jgi:hypothetical protein
MGSKSEEGVMRAMRRRVERLELATMPSAVEPTTFVYVPHNGRDDAPPGRFRIGPATLVVYVPGEGRGQYCPDALPALQPGCNCP